MPRMDFGGNGCASPQSAVRGWKADRSKSMAVIALCYVAALGAGIMAFFNLDGELWWRLLVADVAATLVIWASTLVFDNASIYDPYWSVQPIVIVDILLFGAGRLETGPVLLALVINIWGARLTANWAYTFSGLDRQDWRYDIIRGKTGKLFPVASLLGIQMMPTLIVYSCILPAVYYVTRESEMNLLTAAGLAISSAGIALEAVADYQMHSFRRKSPDRARIMRRGLWKNSRHPNYLGEIMMWWGVYVTMLSSHPDLWRLGSGALANTALFLFISIPMAERRMAAYKDGFKEYLEQTRPLLPIPRRPEREERASDRA
ncbi:MAG TPA: DUF1295 domain-containing protein [Bacillota bacterium]|nr:DUF1295 domain-containing protein [Bacillota bacterium]